MAAGRERSQVEVEVEIRQRGRWRRSIIGGERGAMERDSGGGASHGDGGSDAGRRWCGSGNQEGELILVIGPG